MNIFQQFEMESMATDQQSSLEGDRQLLNEICEFFRKQPWQQESMEVFGEIRKLSYQILLKSGSFFIHSELKEEEVPQQYKADRLGLFKRGFCAYLGNYMYPVHDVKGNVAGFTGYDKFSKKSKYYDSKGLGYLSKTTMFYGMQDMEEFYGSDHLFIPEGVVEKLWLQDNGLCSVAALGSYLAPYMIEICKRFQGRVIFMPDSDEAGEKLRKQIKRELPLARIIQSALNSSFDDQRIISQDLEEEMLYELREYIKKPYNSYRTLRRA